MTPDDVRTAAGQLVDFHEEFAPLLGMRQARDHAFDDINGLLPCPWRKSVEPIALLVAHGDVSGPQIQEGPPRRRRRLYLPESWSDDGPAPARRGPGGWDTRG